MQGLPALAISPSEQPYIASEASKTSGDFLGAGPRGEGIQIHQALLERLELQGQLLAVRDRAVVLGAQLLHLLIGQVPHHVGGEAVGGGK